MKSRSSLLAPAHLVGPGKRAVKRLWCGGGALTVTDGRQEKVSASLSAELVWLPSSAISETLASLVALV